MYRTLISCILIFFGISIENSFSQSSVETKNVLVVHPVIGDEIDSLEKVTYKLFPFVSNNDFVSAFFYSDSIGVVLKIKLINSKTRSIRYKLEDFESLKLVISQCYNSVEIKGKKAKILKASLICNQRQFNQTYGNSYGASISYGFPIKKIIIDTDMEIDYGRKIKRTTRNLEYSFHNFIIRPSLIYFVKSDDLKKMYFKVGVHLGTSVGNEKSETQRPYYDYSTSIIRYENITTSSRYSKGITSGFQLSCGYQRKISRFNCFILGGMNSIKYSPRKKEILEYIVSGEDETKYLADKITIYSNHPNPERLQEKSKIGFDLSSFFINVGLVFPLNSSAEK